MTDKFDLTNVNNMVFYISGPKLLFETTEISTHPNSTQQESNYIYLYTTKFGTSKKIRLNRKFESTEFETTRVNCIYFIILYIEFSSFESVYSYKVHGKGNKIQMQHWSESWIPHNLPVHNVDKLCKYNIAQIYMYGYI